MASDNEWFNSQVQRFIEWNSVDWAYSVPTKRKALLQRHLELQGAHPTDVSIWLEEHQDVYNTEMPAVGKTRRLDSAEIAPQVLLDAEHLALLRANLPQPIPQRSLTTDDWNQVAYLDSQTAYLGRKRRLPGCGFMLFWTVYFLITFVTGLGSNFFGAILLFIGVLAMIGWDRYDRRQIARRNHP